MKIFLPRGACCDGPVVPVLYGREAQHLNHTPMSFSPFALAGEKKFSRLKKPAPSHVREGAKEHALFDRSAQWDIRAGLHDRLVTFHLLACSAYPERPTISLVLIQTPKEVDSFYFHFSREQKQQQLCLSVESGQRTIAPASTCSWVFMTLPASTSARAGGFPLHWKFR